MVSIPEQIDLTLDAMRRISAERGNGEPRRGYLGASELGRQCVRAIWYSFTGVKGKPREAKLCWAAEDGHHTEELIAKRLRMIPGVELQSHNEHGEQLGFSVLDGRFQGHCDGVIKGLIQAPKAVHIWENKTKAQKYFDDFQKKKRIYGEKRALKEWNETYYVQAQLYMHFMQINRHYLTVALPGGRDIDSCRTEYKPEVGEAAYDRAQKLLNITVPPPRINDKADFFVCKMCEHADHCR